nr:IS630 family transposase [Gammaproteobacteria bacterium]
HCVCPLLDTLAALTPQRPITVVSDNERLLSTLRTRANARRPTQHRTALSTGLLPNLNLIERLWKFVKKQCLYAKHYPDFGTFTNAIQHCLQETHTLPKQALSSL